MNLRPFHEIRLRDFRCFHEKQKALLAPLTLLVGNNSTGKTSFLAAIRAVWEIAYEQNEPDFRKPPYDLGGFGGIAHSRGGRGGTADSFEIGFSGGRSCPRIEFDVAFKSRAAVPTPSLISWRMGDLWIERCVDDPRVLVDFGSSNGSWRFIMEHQFAGVWTSLPIFFTLIRGFINEQPDRLQRLTGPLDAPSSEHLEEFSRLLNRFHGRPLSEFGRLRQPFASAPIRSRPRRTYDPTRPLPDPEGAYVPTYLASMNFRNRNQWLGLKKKLEDFGRESGLFDEIGVRQLGRTEGGPFQLQVRKFSENRKKGPKRNLIDVGYGVSQTLPVLAELYRPDSPSMFLFQQPEVHLHPSAQAALGSLFCETAASGRQLIVETHSDYIMNRIRLDVRDRRTKLKPDDVSILYFEHEDLDVRIHSMRIDDDGNVLNAPNGYRRFFTDELNRSLDY